MVVDAPIPAGEWCVDQHGTILSVAAEGFGTLTLAGPVEPAAATVELPGEIEEGEPVERELPEPPEETPSPDAEESPEDASPPSPSPSAEPERSE